MYTDDDSLYVWERHALPADWKEKLLDCKADGPAAPVMAAIHDIVRRCGDQSIFLWQVQELALAACGHTRPRFRAAYEHVCSRLMAAAGGSAWPLTSALEEHLRGNVPITQLPLHFVACEGEWFAAMRLADDGWHFVERERRPAEADWIVRRNGAELSVEVKTKSPLASATGRLNRAFMGLAMLPEHAFLRDIDFEWYTSDALDDQTLRAFISDFMRNAGTIASRGRDGKPARVPLPIDDGSGRMFVRGPNSYRVEITRREQHVVFNALPAAFREHVFTGGGGARISKGFDAEMPFLAKGLERLLRKNQKERMDADTLLFFVWHMPFPAFSYSAEQLSTFWRSWCEEHEIVRGALQPVTPVGNFQPLILTNAAATATVAARTSP